RPQERTLSASEIITERERFDTALERVRQQFDASLSADIPTGDRTIITALREISDDEELSRLTVASIERGLDAVSAVIAASSQIAQSFRNLEDAYLSARSEDIEAVGRQICLALLGEEQPNLADIPEGAILVAEDIGAWDLARAPLDRIAGIACGR